MTQDECKHIICYCNGNTTSFVAQKIAYLKSKYSLLWQAHLKSLLIKKSPQVKERMTLNMNPVRQTKKKQINYVFLF